MLVIRFLCNFSLLLWHLNFPRMVSIKYYLILRSANYYAYVTLPNMSWYCKILLLFWWMKIEKFGVSLLQRHWVRCVCVFVYRWRTERTKDSSWADGRNEGLQEASSVLSSQECSHYQEVIHWGMSDPEDSILLVPYSLIPCLLLLHCKLLHFSRWRSLTHISVWSSDGIRGEVGPDSRTTAVIFPVVTADKCNILANLLSVCLSLHLHEFWSWEVIHPDLCLGKSFCRCPK